MELHTKSVDNTSEMYVAAEDNKLFISVVDVKANRQYDFCLDERETMLLKALFDINKSDKHEEPSVGGVAIEPKLCESVRVSYPKNR